MRAQPATGWFPERKGQAQSLELLTRLSSELGLAVILVTHDLPVVAQVCDRAAVMYAGEIAEFTGISAPYEAPEGPELVVDTNKEPIEACVENRVSNSMVS